MKIIITGGAGFIGINAANRFLRNGHDVVIFDSLVRQGVERNLQWLASTAKFEFVRGDVGDAAAVEELFARHRDVAVVLHLAAQSAVTLSIENPRVDFEANALGTLNLLEAIRKTGLLPAFVFASTNKVYGGLEGFAVPVDGRYRFRDGRLGVNEEQAIDPHSPYACSKAAGDQYVRDYARVYGFRTVVFRQSCIYGPWQLGVEDQGWVAWFLFAAMRGEPITVFGDGQQVRDLLFVDDLLDAYEAAIERIDEVRGRAYNIGGGPAHTMSVWSEFEPLLARVVGSRPFAQFAPWRVGDQRIYVSDISKAQRELGWTPQTPIPQGLLRLFQWAQQYQPAVL